MVPVTLGETLTMGRPTGLFRMDPGALTAHVHLYAAAPDGQRFLVNEHVPSEDHITVVLHWTALLRR